MTVESVAATRIRMKAIKIIDCVLPKPLTLQISGGKARSSICMFGFL